MKKSTKITLIVGSALVAVGLVCGLTAWALAGFRLSNLSTVQPAATAEADYGAADVTSLVVETAADGVRIVPSDDGRIHVAYPQREGDGGYTLTVRDGRLELKQPRRSGSVVWFGFGVELEDADAVLSLPAGWNGDVTLDVSVGDVSGRGVSVGGGLTVSADGGNVTLQDVAASAISVTLGLGDVEGTGWSVDGAAEIMVDGGDADLTDVTAASLTCRAGLGNVTLERAAAESVAASTDGGDVEVSRLQADHIDLRTDMGDVSGTVDGREADYAVTASTGLGDSSLTSHGGETDRTLTVTTDMGDIDVAFLGE